jgi:hypothetical protein
LRNILSTLGIQMASPLCGSVHDASDAQAWQKILYKLRIYEAVACLSWVAGNLDWMGRYGWEKKTSRRYERLGEFRVSTT